MGGPYAPASRLVEEVGRRAVGRLSQGVYYLALYGRDGPGGKEKNSGCRIGFLKQIKEAGHEKNHRGNFFLPRSSRQEVRRTEKPVVVATNAPSRCGYILPVPLLPTGGITHKMLPHDTPLLNNAPDFGRRCWAYYHDPGTKTSQAHR